MNFIQEKYEQVKQSLCFYLDIQDNAVARTLTKRIEDLGLSKEVFLTDRVTHVVRDGAAPTAARWAPREGPRSRADAMLQRVRPDEPPPEQPPALPPLKYDTISVHRAVLLLDKIYDTFFNAPRRSRVRLAKRHFIKIEFLDKVCRPVFKEFDELPDIAIDPDPPREKKSENIDNLKDREENKNTIGQKMTRKSRPRVKERENDKETKAGYCEMCTEEYVDAGAHQRSARHAAFVRDARNYLALDTLIAAAPDVGDFLRHAAPLLPPPPPPPGAAERRSQRNGHLARKLRDASPHPAPHPATTNGDLHDERRPRRTNGDLAPDQRHFYKLVNTKLRSSGGCQPRPKTPPPCNGTKPIVVKFRKVRRSELSVLSDEAEQFMFPKRASSSSSSSEDDDDDDDEKVEREVKSEKKIQSPLQRRRQARPLALKEESSEEDSWPEDKRRRRKKPQTPLRKSRRGLGEPEMPHADEKEPTPERKPAKDETVEEPVTVEPAPEVSPLREEKAESCMKWEDGRLKYAEAVEQLEFAFESVPRSEPWYDTFRRQDQDKVVAKNINTYFSTYSSGPAPVLPYELGVLPPLRADCCALSALSAPARPAPAPRLYGTRQMKKQRSKKRTLAVLAMEAHPRKSPREHASTLAILGSVGLLRRRDDSDDTRDSDTTAASLPAPAPGPAPATTARELDERYRQFLSSVYADAAECDVAADCGLTMSRLAPDVPALLAGADQCRTLQDELSRSAPPPPPRARRRTKLKNRTGWPVKRKAKKDSRTDSAEMKCDDAESGDDARPSDSLSERHDDEDDEPLKPPKKSLSVSSGSEEQVVRKRSRTDWLPVVRVARVDAGRRLRSAAPRPRPRPPPRPRR